MNSWRGTLAALTLIAVGAAGVTIAAGHPAGDVVASVIEVPDGDTVIVEIAGERRTVDLLGVRAPSPSSCQGKRARAALRWMLPRLIRVRIAPAAEIPESGRFAAEIRLPGAVGVATVSRAVLAAGNGRARLNRPRSRFRAAYLSAERAARGHDRGLWGTRCAQGEGTGATQPEGEGRDEVRPGDPPPPPPDPGPRDETEVARVARLLTGVAILRRTVTSDGEVTETEETRIDFCPAARFAYRNYLESEGAESVIESAGTWSVRQDAVAVTFIDYAPTGMVKVGPHRIQVTEAPGLQVLLDGQPYTASAATC